MKKHIITAITIALTIGSSLAEEVVNLYSQRHYPADKEVFAKFTEKTGIKVNVVKANADELIERLKSEGKESPADILFTKDAARLFWASSEGPLQTVDSALLSKRVPSHLRDPNNQWFGLTQRARVIVYAKDRVKAGEIENYADLAKPQWKGRVVVRSASHIYNQSLLASMIAHDGEKKALLWAVKFRKNMARAPQGSDRDQIRAVAAGLADAAIVNSYYLGLLANSVDPKDREVASKVQIIFPDQEGHGTHVNISGVGICKHSKNKANAMKFLEFMTSEEAQHMYPEKTYEYPLSLKLQSAQHKAWGDFKPDKLNLKALGEHNARAVKLFQAAQWEGFSKNGYLFFLAHSCPVLCEKSSVTHLG